LTRVGQKVGVLAIQWFDVVNQLIIYFHLAANSLLMVNNNEFY